MLALGPVPVVGEDETFQNGFTIHAEKCPNRRGVEAVLAALQRRVLTHSTICSADVDARRRFAPPGSPAVIQQPWIDEATAERFAGLELLIVQDMFDSPLWQRATYQLPGASFAERDGSYVNLRRSAAIVRVGDPAAGRRVGRRGALLAAARHATGCTSSRSVLRRSRRARLRYFAAAGGDSSAGRRRFESEPAGRATAATDDAKRSEIQKFATGSEVCQWECR